jgi:hypothetical protein
MRRFILLWVACLLTVGLTATVALAEGAPPKKGQPGATEDKSTGEPTNANGFGTVTSQVGSTTHTVGDHSSGFAPGQDPEDNAKPAQRLGVGNVSRNDGFLDPDPDAGVDDTGTRPGDHSCLIDAIDGNDNTNCLGDPGLPNG